MRLQSLAETFLLGDFHALSPGRGLGGGTDSVPFIKQAVLINAGVNWSVVSSEPVCLKNNGDVQLGDILLACTALEVYYVAHTVDFVRSVPENLNKINSAVADLMIIHPRQKKAD